MIRFSLFLALAALCGTSFCWSQAARIEAAPPMVLSPQEAVKQGRELVASLLNRQPDPVTNTGVLRVRNRERKETEFAVFVTIRPTSKGIVSTYEARSTSGEGTNHVLEIVYRPGTSNDYFLLTNTQRQRLVAKDAMVPFAGSDFSLADLGLEFLHWPVQLLVRKEMRRGQATSVLESVNPQPRAPEYSRVVSWIDNDTGGIVHADAYDASGKLVKQFSPTHLQRVQGQYQVRQIEMRNRRTGSRSIIEFNLQ